MVAQQLPVEKNPRAEHGGLATFNVATSGIGPSSREGPPIPIGVPTRIFLRNRLPIGRLRRARPAAGVAMSTNPGTETVRE